MLHFAVAGVPHSTKSPGGTIEGLKRAHELGITAMELEWVQRVPLNPDRMMAIRTVSEQLGMYLTIHAPYYVNLNSAKPETFDASKKRILDALTMAELAGAHSVCVHAAFNHADPPEKVYDRIRGATESMLKLKSRLFPSVNLAYETMGKQSQFGTLEEVLKISKEFDLYPTLDPAHLHARYNGKINSTEEWNEMFDMYESYLGKKSLQSMHMHFSGIAYGPKGERHHLELEKSDAKWKDFLTVLKKRKIGGTLVCESPILEEDTLRMKNFFLELA